MSTGEHEAARAARGALDMTLLTATRELLADVTALRGMLKAMLIAQTGIFITLIGIMINEWVR